MASDAAPWWSRAWGALATLAFALLLGACVYDAAVVAPLWLASPPASVRAWAALELRPDASSLMLALVVASLLTTTMAWIGGISTRGPRRLWLTLALASAAALGAVTVLLVRPCERQLFGAGGLGGSDDAALVALAGDWLRAAAMRLAAAVVGAWAALRAQAGAAGAARGAVPVAPSRRPARGREFSFGDEDDDESFDEEAAAARRRWRGSLGGRRRTAKK